MNDRDLILLLEEVVKGALPATDAAERLKRGPFQTTDLEFANLDHHRSLRHRLGEVIYGESKTVEQILAIVEKFAESGVPVLTTRLNAEKMAAMQLKFPTGRANVAGRTFVVNPPAIVTESGEPYVAILAAGTSDLPVAEEACEVCVAMRVPFVRIYDVGVSGLHRLCGDSKKCKAPRRWL